MQREETHTDFGTVKIHKKVIASIASIAAQEIEGVKRIGGDLKSGIIELIGKKYLSSVKVEINKNEEVNVEIPVVIKYGYNVPEVANSVQENVRNSLEKMTNLSVKEVNISVQGIERG
jgi:uncharacterized alkaline shock family protein YloU